MSESIIQELSKDLDIYLCNVTKINFWSERSACIGATIFVIFSSVFQFAYFPHRRDSNRVMKCCDEMGQQKPMSTA